MELEIVGRCLAAPIGGACSGYAIHTEQGSVLLDCGPGILERLWARGLVEHLDAVIVSHMHQDHFLDLVPLSNMVSQDALRRVRRDQGRLPVHVPRGRGPEILSAVALALGDQPTRFADAFDLREYDGGETLTLGSLEITFARTAHPEPCFAPRVSDGSTTLVYGADGAVSAELEAHARGADLLLVEATFADPGPELERHGHMTGEQAGELAHRAGVGRLVLTHLSPWIEGQDAENRHRAANRFGGPVDLATEGLRLAVSSR